MKHTISAARVLVEFPDSWDTVEFLCTAWLDVCASTNGFKRSDSLIQPRRLSQKACAFQTMSPHCVRTCRIDYRLIPHKRGLTILSSIGTQLQSTVFWDDLDAVPGGVMFIVRLMILVFVIDFDLVPSAEFFEF